MKLHTEYKTERMVTGNHERPTEDELEFIIWAFDQDIKGDMGLRSNAGVYEVQGNFEPIRPKVDAAGVIKSMYVKKPKENSKKHEMGDKMLAAAATDREARAVLKSIGAHLTTLWQCYAAPYPEELRKSLAVFADLAPLAPGTKAAHRSLLVARAERADKSPTLLSYCQALSGRVLKAQETDIALDELDSIAMQEICAEAEPQLTAACRALKTAMRGYRSAK